MTDPTIVIPEYCLILRIETTVLSNECGKFGYKVNIIFDTKYNYY